MPEKFRLGPFEELVLRVVLQMGEQAYGVPIRKGLEEVTGRPVSIGAVYSTLERLEEKGFVSSRLGDPTPERGGRAKRFFKVEAAGELALTETERERQRLTAWSPALNLGGA
jgi:DNA-binding PadR family transcriptional regulator